LLPLRSVTGAIPAYFWNAPASTKRSRVLAEGGEQPGREDRSRAGQVGKETKVREVSAASSDLRVEAGDAGVEGAELRQESRNDKESWLDDSDIRGQGQLGFDGIDATVDDGGTTNAVGVEEVDDGVAPGALGVG
jgi:hypothetical protein